MKTSFKLKITAGIVLLLVAVASFVFKIYIWDSAKYTYCVTQSREEYPENTGAPSEEQLTFFDECYKSLNGQKTIDLIFSRK